MPPSYWIGEEEVNGIIIGPITYPYEFWIDEPREEYQTKRGIPKRRLAKESFENDDEANAWFKENFPEEYANRKDHPIEMRVFDQR